MNLLIRRLQEESSSRVPTQDRRPSPAVRWTVALALATGSVPASEIPVEFLAKPQGLSSAQVHAVLQDDLGAIWLAGPDGLTRIQGSLTARFGLREGLSTPGLRALALDRWGRLWVGTDMGVDAMQADGRFAPLAGPDDWEYGLVDQLAFDDVGRLWIAAAEGLVVWSQEEGLRRARDRRLQDVLIVSVAVHGRDVWAATRSEGVFHLEESGWRALPEKGWREVAPVRCLRLARDGNLLVGGETGFLELSRTGEVLERIVGDESGFGRVTAILEAGSELWLGTSGGLRLHRAGPQGWEAGQLLPDLGAVNDLMQDSQGNVWAATDNAGVGRISALRHVVQRPPQPCRGSVYSIRKNKRGQLLIGGQTCSWRTDEETLEAVQRIDALDSYAVWDLHEDASRQIWAATEQGLMRLSADGEKRLPVGNQHPLLSGPTRVLMPRGSELWVGTVAGLVRLEAGRVEEILTSAGESFDYVYTLAQDGEGKLWVGTLGKGLWRDGENGFQAVIGEGLSPTGSVYSVTFADSGEAFVAHNDRIVKVGKDGASVLPYHSESQVAASSILSGPDTLWIGGGDGLIRYIPSSGLVMNRLNASIGLSGEEFITSRSLMQISKSRLACGTDGGLHVVNAEKLRLFSTPPTVRLASVQWHGARIEQDDHMPSVQTGTWTLDVRFYSPWQIDPSSLRFRSRLSGGNWSEPSPQPYLRYTGLAPGEYDVEAAAFSPLTGWGMPTSLYMFRVRTPWWRRDWALAVMALLTLALMQTLWSWRNRILVRRARELEGLVSERTAQLEKANAALAKMATTDGLTEIANYRSFSRFLKRQWRAAMRERQPLSLVMLDIDHFKAYNDAYGHRAGDECLKKVASRLTELTRRPGDLAARYGGEEFVVVLSNTPAEAARRLAERLRGDIEALKIANPGSETGCLTLSLGVSTCVPAPEQDSAMLVEAADKALYQAKAEGRNRVR